MRSSARVSGPGLSRILSGIAIFPMSWSLLAARMERARHGWKPSSRATAALALDREHAPVTRHDAKEVRAVSLFRTRPSLEAHPIKIVGVDDLEQEVGVVEPLLRRVSEHPLDLRTDVRGQARRARQVEVRDHGQVLDELAKECDVLLVGVLLRHQPMVPTRSHADQGSA